MNARKLHLLMVLLLLLWSGTAGAVHPFYNYKQLSIQQGFPAEVTALYDNGDGSIWIGTALGLYRFNGVSVQRCPDAHPEQRSTLYVNDIVGDYQGRIWELVIDGVGYCTEENDTVRLLTLNGQPVKATALKAEKEELWIATADTLLVYDTHLSLKRTLVFSDRHEFLYDVTDYDPRHYLVRTGRKQLWLLDKESGRLLPPPFRPTEGVHHLYADSQGCFWISYYGKGVQRFRPDGTSVDTYSTRLSNLSNDIVLDIAEWLDYIWIATDGGGVNILSPTTGERKILCNDNEAIPANSVTRLFPVKKHLWMGLVREGVFRVEKGFIHTYTKVPAGNSSGLSDKCPLCLWEDTDGSLWIGTDGGGVNRFHPATHHFEHFPLTKNEKVVSVCPYSDSELLVSCFSKGLFLLNKSSGAFRPLRCPYPPIEQELNHSGFPVNLRQGKDGRIEIYGKHIYHYHPATGKWEDMAPVAPPVEQSWVCIGTYRSSPVFYDRKHVFLYHEDEHRYSLLTPSDGRQVPAACMDRNGHLWTSTLTGIERTDLSSGRKENIGLPDGNHIVTSLVADCDGIIWMGCNGYLYAYDPVQQQFTLYSDMDGVLPNDFLPKCVGSTADGNVYLGGSEGLVRIDKSLIPATSADDIGFRLSELQTDGKNTPLPLDGRLELPYNFSSLQVQSVPTGEDNLRKRIYRFHLKGKNNEHIETVRPSLSIPTLPPGNYQLRIQCSRQNGQWSPEYTLLRIQVLQPWWLQNPFLVLWGLLFLALAAGVAHGYDLHLKRTYSEKERHIYEEKVKGLININHGLRTPLTLIYSPLKQLIGSRTLPLEHKKTLLSVFKQTRQMKNLIDMTLTLRKMEKDPNPLRMSCLPFNEWLRGILDDFQGEFSLRNITLTFVPDPTVSTMFFDANQCEIILNNLLSNAYKFSPRNSLVTVSTRLDSHVRVEVKDQGTGLSPDDFQNLFHRFHQGNHSEKGTGIGLSCAKELVELHGGVIGAANNTDGPGSTFFFTLPYRQQAASIQTEPQPYLNKTLDTPLTLPKPETRIPAVRQHSVLVVDADPDMRSYLVSNLQSMFVHVYEANDGKEAIPLLTTHLPQLVIAEVRLPRMNGLELCSYIKQKPELNYLPVILLTAEADDSDIEKGYQTGAEAYITKPFDMDLLLTQLQNILHNHTMVKKHYSSLNAPISHAADMTPPNEQFLLQLQRIVQENLGNTELDVNFIAQAIGMSRASLYNKVKGMLEGGIGEYILKCRIDYARRLLEETDLPVAAVAEKAGFKHPRNFSTLFKTAHGCSPTDYRKQHKSAGKE